MGAIGLAGLMGEKNEGQALWFIITFILAIMGEHERGSSLVRDLLSLRPRDRGQLVPRFMIR